MEQVEIRVLSLIILCSFIILLLTFTVITIITRAKRKINEKNNHLNNYILENEKKQLSIQLDIQESILSSISKEIHDNISLGLTLAKLQLNRYLIEEEPDREKISLSIELIGKSLTDLNNLSKSSDGEQLLSFGLTNAIESEIRILEQSKLYEFKLEIIGDQYFLNPKTEITLFRIFQEACNNIIKYSRANQVEIQLIYNQGEFCLKIYDDGIGFDVEEQMKKKEIRKMSGIKNICSRAEYLGGKASIYSVINKGTTIVITIPQKQ